MTYEILLGQAARFHRGNPWELLRMHREEPPPHPERFGSGLPDRVCAALLRGLSKDPNHRFASCEEFAREIGCRLISGRRRTTADPP